MQEGGGSRPARDMFVSALSWRIEMTLVKSLYSMICISAFNFVKNVLDKFEIGVSKIMCLLLSVVDSDPVDP